VFDTQPGHVRQVGSGCGVGVRKTPGGGGWEGWGVKLANSCRIEKLRLCSTINQGIF